MVKVAILGYGTVGSGVYDVIKENNEIVSRNSGDKVEVKYVLDLRKFPGDEVENILVDDYQTIVNDKEVNVICETMGGINPAYEFTKQALAKGISVCTSNKELVAGHGPELIALAAQNNCNYRFEASVGGGIPIIRALNDCLTGEKIDAISGILNGTTNFILTKMSREGADFAEVLKEAQDKGYAEKNPEADVEGHDACRKIAILSSLMYGENVDYKQIYTEGITKITAMDFQYVKSMNSSIKIMGISKNEDGKAYAMVAPFIINNEHPLYNVNDVFNGIFVHSNMLDNSMYYGRGAGKLPTASAVVADVVDCAKNLGKALPYEWSANEKKLNSIDSYESAFFVRVNGNLEDKLAAVKGAFGNVTTLKLDGNDSEFAFTTNKMTEVSFAEKIKEVDGVITRIRMEI